MGYQKGLDEDKINNHYQKTLNQYKGSMNSSGEDVKDLRHKAPGSGRTQKNDLLHTSRMGKMEILESLDDVSASLDALQEDPLNASTDINSEPEVPSGLSDEEAILNELNQIFTPILIMQSFESDTTDQIKEAFEEASVLLERNIIKFDDDARMAQLLSVCALLIEKQRNSPEYQTYQKAASIRNKQKVEIEKKNYEQAKIMAQKYLIKVSTTNNSSVARQAATDLLPATQH